MGNIEIESTADNRRLPKKRIQCLNGLYARQHKCLEMLCDILGKKDSQLAQVCGKAMKHCVLVPDSAGNKYPTRKALQHTFAREVILAKSLI